MNATVELVDRHTWQTLTSAFNDHNYRHLWEFGVACAERVGARSEHVIIRNHDEVLGFADVRIRRVPFLGAGIAYVNGGPLVRRGDGNDVVRLRTALEALEAEYVRHRHLVLRIAPAIGSESWAREQQITLKAMDAIPSSQAPYRTHLLSIDRPMDALRAGLSPKWRNNLKRAEAVSLEIRAGRDEDICDDFAALHSRFREQKRFDLDLDAAFYARVHAVTAPEERFYVALAYSEGELIAGHLSSMLGDTAVVLLRATAPAARLNRAAYRLQWHALSVAKERGYRYFDLGGVDPEANPGVYEFKKGLGGIDITAPGPFEFRPSCLTASMLDVAERIYRQARNLGRASSLRG